MFYHGSNQGLSEPAIKFCLELRDSCSSVYSSEPPNGLFRRFGFDEERTKIWDYIRGTGDFGAGKVYFDCGEELETICV